MIDIKTGESLIVENIDESVEAKTAQDSTETAVGHVLKVPAPKTYQPLLYLPFVPFELSLSDPASSRRSVYVNVC